MKAYRFSQLAYIITGLYIAFFSGIDRAPLGLVSLLFLAIPTVAERLFKMQLGYPLKTCILLFSLLAFSLGTALRWYDAIWFYDILMHLLSGVFFTLMGLCLYSRISGDYGRTRNIMLQLTYAFFFSMFIAVVWEMYEYIAFLLTGHDAQHHLTTGVVDTMEDIICCFVGSAVMSADFLIYKWQKKSLLMGPVLSFDLANQDRKL